MAPDELGGRVGLGRESLEPKLKVLMARLHLAIIRVQVEFILAQTSYLWHALVGTIRREQDTNLAILAETVELLSQ